MKNILTTILLLAAFTLSAQLEPTAQAIKEINPQEYGLMKAYAEQQFESDYTMVVYSINKQAESYYEFMLLASSDDVDEDVLFSAMDKWINTDFYYSDKGKATYLYDYGMILYTYKKQLEAKNSY